MKILIRGGRVIDPASRIDSQFDLMVEDGKIAGIGSPEGADRIIDATGQVVCPGFIDIHMHEDPVDTEGRIKQCIFPAMLKMGVTTVLGGNCGSNVYHPADYLDLIDRDGAAVNVAMLAGHEYFRTAAGQSDKYLPITPPQQVIMNDQIRQALQRGCIGISFGLRYVPGTTTQEFLTTASCAAEENRLVSAHVRDDADAVFHSVAEFAAAGRAYGVPLQVSHIGSMGGYGQMERLLRQMDVYQTEGIDISADCYPYDAFSTGIGSATYDDGWLERYRCGYDVLEMCEGPYKGQRCTKEIFDEMRRDLPDALTVCYVMNEEDVRMAYRHPNVMAGSDGTLNDGQGHPRAAGTFPRILSRFVREEHMLSLYEAIEKMTTMPAKRMGLAKKGNLKTGSDADIVIFDPETIRDRSTFAHPLESPEGISYVLIGGQIALKEGRMVNDRLGRAVRYGET